MEEQVLRETYLREAESQTARFTFVGRKAVSSTVEGPVSDPESPQPIDEALTDIE